MFGCRRGESGFSLTTTISTFFISINISNFTPELLLCNRKRIILSIFAVQCPLKWSCDRILLLVYIMCICIISLHKWMHVKCGCWLHRLARTLFTATVALIILTGNRVQSTFSIHMPVMCDRTGKMTLKLQPVKSLSFLLLVLLFDLAVWLNGWLNTGREETPTDMALHIERLTHNMSSGILYTHTQRDSHTDNYARICRQR